MDTLTFIEPRTEYDQFIKGVIDINTTTATVYDKDQILKHLSERYREEGFARDEDEATLIAVEYFDYNLAPLFPRVLFISEDELMLTLDANGETLHDE